MTNILEQNGVKFGTGEGGNLGSICALSGTLAIGFMPKYGNFENRHVSRKPLPIERTYAQFGRRGVEREYMCKF